MNYVVGFEHTFKPFHRHERLRLDSLASTDESSGDCSPAGTIYAGDTDGSERATKRAAGCRLRFHSSAIIGWVSAVHDHLRAAEFFSFRQHRQRKCRIDGNASELFDPGQQHRLKLACAV